MTSIQTSNGQLYYRRHEGGNSILLAFHGFGQNNEIFNDWVAIIKEEYTIYAFDLFYHGSSTRSDKKLTKGEWNSYINTFLEKENIERFSIIGFSLGGRFAISSALSLPNQVDELILIAPDGVYLTLWFKLATKPVLRKLFKYLMYHPNKLDRLIQLNKKFKLVSPYLGDFIKKEMGDLPNRKRVYVSWNHFKSLGYSKRQLFNRFNQYQFSRRIILGSNDYIIHPKNILPIIGKMGKFKVDILPLKHHQLIKPEVAKLLIRKKE